MGVGEKRGMGEKDALAQEKARDAELLPRLNPNSDASSVSALAGNLKFSREAARRIVVKYLGAESFKKTKVRRLGTKMKQKRPNAGVLLKAAFSRKKYDIRPVFSAEREVLRYGDSVGPSGARASLGAEWG